MKKIFLIIAVLTLVLLFAISTNQFGDTTENYGISSISSTSNKYVNTLHKFSFELPKNTKVYDGRNGWDSFGPNPSVISYIQLYSESGEKLPYRIFVYEGGANQNPDNLGAVVTYPDDGDGTRYTVVVDGYSDQNKLNNGNAPASLQMAADMIENSFSFVFETDQEDFSFQYPDGLDVRYNPMPSGDSMDNYLFYTQYCGSVDCTHPVFYGLRSDADSLSEVELEIPDGYTAETENIKLGDTSAKKATLSSETGSSTIIRLYFLNDMLYVYEADVGSDDRHSDVNRKALNLFIDSFRFIPEY